MSVVVGGRKTDVKDAEWIAELLQHGLLKVSYVPDKEQRELRDIVRYRKSLIEERIVTTQIFKLRLVFQHVVYGYDHGMRDRNSCPIGPAPYNQTLILRMKKAFLILFCRLCTLNEYTL